MTAAISSERLLRDLEALWTDLAQHNRAAGKGDNADVLRACAMTLIVATDDCSDDGRLNETIAELVHADPARCILLRFCSAEGKSLSAHVTADCWMPFGSREQICCERIEIESPAADLPAVVSILRGLTAADLPVVVWCRSEMLFLAPGFAPILAMADYRILDTKRFREPLPAIAWIAKELAAGRHASDLSWTRLTRWRNLIASTFSSASNLALLSQLREVTIAHATGGLPPAALYLSAWFRHALGARVQIRHEQTSETGAWEVHGISLTGSSQPFRFERSDPHTVQSNTGAISSRVVFPLLSELELMREELAIQTRDRVYHSVMEHASEWLSKNS
jgi:glucose-6-phosphate dehydrogenase assembly protein OpcA